MRAQQYAETLLKLTPVLPTRPRLFDNALERRPSAQHEAILGPVFLGMSWWTFFHSQLILGQRSAIIAILLVITPLFSIANLENFYDLTGMVSRCQKH